MQARNKVLLTILGLFAAIPLYSKVTDRAPVSISRESNDPGSRLLSDAIQAERSGVLLEASGIVEELGGGSSSDSVEQRFVLRLTSDLAIPVTHDLTEVPRVPLAVGDRVRVRGWYEWNEEGGVVSRTRDDTGDQLPGGWILHQGIFYPASDPWVAAQRPAKTSTAAD